MSATSPWWRDAVGYQVYLPSFADSGYRAVDARFGGDRALEELIAAARVWGLHVMADLVVNHTSEACWVR